MKEKKKVCCDTDFAMGRFIENKDLIEENVKYNGKAPNTLKLNTTH